jgi:hypothetical protein
LSSVSSTEGLIDPLTSSQSHSTSVDEHEGVVVRWSASASPASLQSPSAVTERPSSHQPSFSSSRSRGLQLTLSAPGLPVAPVLYSRSPAHQEAAWSLTVAADELAVDGSRPMATPGAAPKGSVHATVSTRELAWAGGPARRVTCPDWLPRENVPTVASQVTAVGVELFRQTTIRPRAGRETEGSVTDALGAVLALLFSVQLFRLIG